MAYWLLKSEPDAGRGTSRRRKARKGAEWDGVRNFQARNNMRAMKKGDLGFFYHSGDDKRVVGIVKVVNEAHPDSTDETGQWECVDVAAVDRSAAAGHARGDQGEPKLQGHGAGRQFAAVGAAGFAARMEYDLQAWRPGQAAVRLRQDKGGA